MRQTAAQSDSQTMLINGTLEKINRAGLKFLEPLDPKSTYANIAKEAAGLVDAHSSALYLMEDRLLTRVATFPFEPAKMIEPRRRGYTYKAYKNQKTYVISGQELAKNHTQFKRKKLGSAIYIPISDHKNNSLGALTVLSYSGREFSARELHALKIFSSYATLAIRNVQLLEQLQKAVQNRDLFISMAAHELRTPLTSVSGYIQLLHSKLSGSNTAESRWLEQLLSESRRLSNLVNELLEINRIKAGNFQYTWKECSLRDLINRAVNIFKMAYTDREITFKDETGDRPDNVIGDFDKLIQVLTNLLDNAIKFSSIPAPIDLFLKFDHGFWTIKVQDYGIGIEKKDLNKIFEGYYRGNGHNREGMGLGLFLAKDIIHQHKGEIIVKSTLKKGTTISIKLPEVKSGRSRK